MSNEDGSIWITYNGEIYEYERLREELQRAGHRFRSDTDTEVLIHLYEDRGVACLDAVQGMFAFALWDTAKRTLLLARDRMGIKPLFYYAGKDKLLFGSEIKCILCDEDVPRHVSLESLHHYLSLNYVPAPLTMFEGIKQLLPGHCIVVENGRFSIHEYWDLEFDEKKKQCRTSEYADHLSEKIHASVARRLVCDVPFGVFLSGGIDSSTVAYYMSEVLDQPVKTFSIGFKESSYSELPYARLVARHLHTEHYEHTVDVKGLDTLLPKLIWHAEEPLADASMVPVYHVAKLAREHVKMVLCGDGADEILAGYSTYPAYYASQAYRMIPKWFRENAIARCVKLLPMSERKISFDYKAKRFVRGAGLSPERAHYSWRLILTEEEKRRLYTDDISRAVMGLDTFEETYAQYFAKTNAVRPLNRLLYADSRFYLPNDMLAKVDRMSMAHSLEARVPFLDQDIVKYVAQLPVGLKLRWFVRQKYLLRKAMEGKLPSVIVRRAKAGFNVPVGTWLRGPLRELLTDALSPESLQRMRIFEPKAIHAMLDDHMDYRIDRGYELWGLLTFCLWWERFIRRGGER
jgi:asparagine synthase (glutamine-hydrolysing)